MTRAEFAQISVVLDECWPSDFTETAEAAFFAVLGSRSAIQVEEALKRLVDRGQTYRPTPAEIVRATRSMTNRGEFIESQRAAFALKHGDAKAAEFFQFSTNMEVVSR